MTAIDVSGLVKRYGDFTALAGVGFEVAEGQVTAPLGPNGGRQYRQLTSRVIVLATSGWPPTPPGRTAREGRRPGSWPPSRPGSAAP